MSKALRRPVLLVVAGLMLLQAAWVITVPPFRGSDEIDHAYRAAAVARGDVIGGEYAENGRGWMVEVPESLVAAAHEQCEALGFDIPDNCSPVSGLEGDTVTVASSAAGYHPAFYWLVGTAALPFDGTASLYAMRIATALLCLVFLGLGAWASTKLGSRRALAATLVAATPVLVFSTAIVAPNGPEMCAALSFWASLLAFAQGQEERTERRLLWVAIASAVVLGTLRLIGPLFILLVLATVAALRWQGLRAAIRRQRGRFALGTVLIGLSVAQFAAWTFGPKALDGSEIQQTTEESTSVTVSDLIVWPLQSIAAFPTRERMGALIVYPVVLAFVGLLLWSATRLATRWDRLVLYASLIAALVLPVILTLLTVDEKGVIWQGRYGLPYGVGFVLIAGLLAARREDDKLPWRLTVPALGVYGVAMAACLLKIRSDELADNPASRAETAWYPWPVLLVALTAAAMAAFLVALSARSDYPSDVTRPATVGRDRGREGGHRD